MFEYPVTSSSSMQNWEHLDFKMPKVERREKKGKKEKPCMAYQQQAGLWDVLRIALTTWPTLQRQGMPSEKLWASPLLRKQNHFCKLSGNNESLNPSPAGLTHTSGNNCYIPKGQQMSAKHGKGGSARFIASQAQKGTTLFVCSCIVKTHQELLVNSIMILRYTASQI